MVIHFWVRKSGLHDFQVFFLKQHHHLCALLEIYQQINLSVTFPSEIKQAVCTAGA